MQALRNSGGGRMNRDGEHLACRFDAYCKRLLKHEVIDATREQKRLGQWETTFSVIFWLKSKTSS